MQSKSDAMSSRLLAFREHVEFDALRKYGCGSKLTRRGKPQVLVHVSTYQGNPFRNSGFLSHSHITQAVL